MKAALPAKGQAAVGILALAAAALWIYAPALRGSWIWDDGLEILGNRALRDPGGLWHAWAAPAGPDYFPLKDCLQWVQWHLWGANVLGFHLTNVALHVAGACLAWRLFARLGIRHPWLGAVAFAVHPLAVESVAWIAEMKNELSLIFALASFLAWIAFERERRGRDRALALAAFAAAMLAKSSAAMLPLVLAGYLGWKRGRLGRRDLASLVPFVAVAAALGWVTIRFQMTRALAAAPGTEEPLSLRLVRGAFAETFYIGKFLWPSHLTPIYSRPTPDLQWGLAWIGAAAVIWVSWRCRRSWGRHALFGLGAFAILLLPAVGIVPMAFSRISWVADHFAYLPLVALTGLAAAGCVRPWFRIALAIACAGWAIQSRRLAAGYANEIVFWTRAVKANPRAWMAHSSLGLIAYHEGRLEQAIAEDRLAERLEPASAEVHNDLGLALFDARRPAEAMAEFREALRLAPHLAAAHNNLANALFALRDLPAAVAEYEAARREAPLDPVFRRNLAAALRSDGAALGNEGRFEAAADRLAQAVALEPESALAHRNLGLALRALGREADAKTQFDLAARLPAGLPASR